MDDEQYSETIVFSEQGFRMAVLADDGSITHLDNWTLAMFGGVLPNVGDHITTLWDPEREDDAESYEVVSRQWIGELKGDNCWWLLLKEAKPSQVDRRLFEVARSVSKFRNELTVGSKYSDLVEIRELLKLKKAAAAKKPKRPARRDKPVPKA